MVRRNRKDNDMTLTCALHFAVPPAAFGSRVGAAGDLVSRAMTELLTRALERVVTSLVARTHHA